MNQEEVYQALMNGGLSGKSARRIITTFGGEMTTVSEDDIAAACAKLGYSAHKTATACAPFEKQAVTSTVTKKTTRPAVAVTDPED